MEKGRTNKGNSGPVKRGKGSGMEERWEGMRGEAIKGGKMLQKHTCSVQFQNLV